jgi:hypothetical protein
VKGIPRDPRCSLPHGVFCTAIVKETDGAIEAVTTVIVKDKGTEKLNASQTVTLKK